MNKDEWRRTFTTIVLGLTSAFSLLISCSHNVSPAAGVGLLGITIGSLLMMVILQIDGLQSVDFKNTNILTGKTGITVSTCRGEHKTIATMTGFVPDRNRIEERSEAEKWLTDELREVLKSGLTRSSCAKGLKLLARHKSIVAASWTHTLNRVRLLAATRLLAEAEELARGVMKRYSHSNEAVGTAYEVLSFIEEFRKPQGKGTAYQQWLRKRRELIVEGLKFLPTGHDLLMNGFEVETLAGNPSEVLAYLNRAVSVDRQRTQENLALNPLTPKAMGLSAEVKEAIKGLIEGENKMKIFNMVRVRALILAAIITTTLGTFVMTLPYHGKELSRGLLLPPTAAVGLLKRVKSFAYSPRVDGTGFGEAVSILERVGTGFGK